MVLEMPQKWKGLPSEQTSSFPFNFGNTAFIKLISITSRLQS